MIRPSIQRGFVGRIARVGALLAVTLGAGCSQHGTGALLRPAPQPISISLTKLAQSSPEWSSLSQLDEVTRLSIQQPAPVPLLFSPVIAPLSASSSTRLNSTTQMSAARREASQRAATGLTIAANRAVSEVQARLERNQARLRALAEDRATQQVAAGVTDAKENATRDYLANLPALLQSDSTARANLRVQINALSVDANPANPQTAPDDHWIRLLKERRAELADLSDAQAAAQHQAEEQIAVQVEVARQSLQKAADAQLAEYEATLDARRDHVLSRQHEALEKEQSELTAVSAELDTELNQPLQAAFTAATLSNSPTALVSGGALNAVSPAAVSRLQMQRQRLEMTILDTTRRRAQRAADELNLKIVDWNSRKPDTKAMDALSKQMGRDVTG